MSENTDGNGNGVLGSSLDRRAFIKQSALLGTGAIAAIQAPWLLDVIDGGPRRQIEPTVDFALAKPENIIYSACQQCNGQCGIKIKIRDGVVVKADGNPYSPWTMRPHLPYNTSPFDTATVEGGICPKGQAGLQTGADPYRIVRVLKRAGPRGSQKWVSIDFDQAIEEIVNGGKLFASVPGEETREVTGLKDIWALRDAEVAKKMSGDVSKILAEKDAAKKADLVDKFKTDYADHLDVMIDPEHPDMGPKNNQLAFVWGRLKAGRGDLIPRFTKDAFGSTNAHGHTTVCQGSLYFTGKAMSEQFVEGKFTGGKKFFWQADQESAEFMIFVGVNPFEASQAPPLRARRITEGLANDRLKYVVVDPRMSRTAAKAWKWLPNIPGSEAAVALALIRLVIENGTFDAQFLGAANKAAAAAVKETSWSNATWLVKIGEDGELGKFLRGSEIGIPTEKRKTADGKAEWVFDPFVVVLNGQPVAFDPNDDKNPVVGDLLVDTTLGDFKVKSSMQILWEEASSRAVEEWAEIAGVRATDLQTIAAEFTSHGKKASVDIHRGVASHTNGFYSCGTWLNLNLLIGNYDWKGGMSAGATFDQAGGKDGQPYPLAKTHPGKTTPFGISIIRHDVKYEDTTLFEDYPAKRPWFPLASDIYQQIVPSAADAYPYPLKAMILYMGTPNYSLPAGQTNIEILADPTKIPLFICSDIVVGETSMYADYIFPDLPTYERWEFAGTHPNVIWKVQPIRQPAAISPNETVTVFGEEMPLSLEALILGLAEKLGLPGFGPGGLGDYGDYKRPEDLYLKEVANVAFGHKADASEMVPDADDKEVELFVNSRRHLPATTFDLQKWQAAVKPELWRKVVYVLNRGGRFDDYEKAYDGEHLKNKYAALINMYQEKTAGIKDSMTGKHFSGIPRYVPAYTDSLGNPIEDEKEGYDLYLITHREITHTKSRTVGNYWLLGINPEGVFNINKKDAERLGLDDGDKVRVLSASNPEGVWDLKNGTKKPMIGKVKVIEGIRPGVISFSLGMGHWAYGSGDVEIDGEVIKGDERRAKGLHANAAMRTDTVNPNTCLSDVVGGSAVFYDTRVKLVKA
ncbi:MAG: molybdopterin-dependent oxidoreductase [Dehalococcoidia bacterium]|nr:molybdopterin-dependent oxidoreductase [Dehalococcoidia bacterium]